MKVLLYVAIAMSFSVNASVYAAADGTQDQTQSPNTELRPYARHSTGNTALKSPTASTSSSRRVMLDGMENPVIREAFHKAQLDLLQTPSDALLHRFFTHDKVAAPMYTQLKAASGKMLDEYSLDARSNMLQLVRGLTPQYDRFDKLFVEIGIDSGIRQRAIDARELYLMPGTLNAATVSGSQNKMIALVSDSLLASMSIKELAAVLAHEVGHIRAEHPVKGMMNNFMLSVIAELFINGKVQINQDVAFQLENLKAENSMVCNGACGHGKHLHGHSLVGNKSSFTGSAIQSFVSNLQNMPQEMFMQSVANYLNVLVQIAQLEKAPPATVEYFRTLEMAVTRVGTFKVHPEEFMEHAKEISLAYSRGKEKTADTISTSLTRNINLASASAKLMGSQFESADKEAQQRIFEQISKQALEVQKAVEADGTMFKYVGGTHPALAHRTLRILNTEAYPSVLFANGFLKQLMILERLMGAEQQTKAELLVYTDKAQISEYIKASLEEYKKQGATEEQLKEIEQRISIQIEQSKQGDIFNFRETAKARFIQETNVMNLLFDPKFPISAKRSTRFENLIQFLAIQKEVKIHAAVELSKQLENLKSSAQNPLQSLLNMAQGGSRADQMIPVVEAQLAAIRKSIDLQNEFANKIKERILVEAEKTQDPVAKENIKQKYALLLRTIQASNTTQLESVRSTATPITVLNHGLRSTSNKIPVRFNQGEPVSSPFAKSCVSLFK